MKICPSALGLALCLIGVGIDQSWSQTRDPKTASPNSSNTQAEQETKEAVNLDLEQLANTEVKVTSASKKSESLNHAPAAIFVLTGEDIRRGGFSSIPEALRTVPGLYVAQEDSHSWIVAARGFSYAFNGKMLVLLDGRLLYQPLFGGVYWDTIDPPLADIDRCKSTRVTLMAGATFAHTHAEPFQLERAELQSILDSQLFRRPPFVPHSGLHFAQSISRAPRASRRTLAPRPLFPGRAQYQSRVFVEPRRPNPVFPRTLRKLASQSSRPARRPGLCARVCLTEGQSAVRPFCLGVTPTLWFFVEFLIGADRIEWRLD